MNTTTTLPAAVSALPPAASDRSTPRPTAPRAGRPFRRTTPGAPGPRGHRIGVLACVIAVMALLAGCGGGSGVDDLTGRWSGSQPEDSMTFYKGGKVSGGSTWPCTGTVHQQDKEYRLDLSCGGFGNVIMTARRSGDDTLLLTDNDGAVHTLQRSRAAQP